MGFLRRRTHQCAIYKRTEHPRSGEPVLSAAKEPRQIKSPALLGRVGVQPKQITPCPASPGVSYSRTVATPVTTKATAQIKSRFTHAVRKNLSPTRS